MYIILVRNISRRQKKRWKDNIKMDGMERLGKWEMGITKERVQC
jgi:hypothetical protein